MLNRFTRTFSSLQSFFAVPSFGLKVGRAERAEAAETGDMSAMQGLWLSLSLGLAYGVYFVLRYGGYWAEGDTVVFARAVDRLQQYGTIFSPLRYDHGYAYSVWMATLSDLTGVSATSLTRWLGPLLGNSFLALIGYAAFRTWLESNRLGMVAASTLLLVPELVFTVSRGNHEKLTVSLTLLASFILIEYLKRLDTPKPRFYIWGFVYLAVVFVLVSLNSIFGSTFIVASTLAFALISLLFLGFKTLRRRFGKTWLPLGALVTLSWGVFLLVIVYIYPQAGSKLGFVRDAFEGILHLFDEREVVTNPYESYGTGGGGQWVNASVARALSSFRWLLLVGSFTTWVYLGLAALRRPSDVSVQRLFLLAIYGAYGFIMAIAFPIDFLGLSAGDNLNVRLYTYFALFAVPMLVLGIVKLTSYAATLFPRRAVYSSASTLFLVFALFSVTKATLDPLVSNFWLQYWPEEPRAVNFWSEKQESSTMYGRGRLRAAYVMTYGGDVVGTNYVRNDRGLLADVADDREMPFSHSLDSALHRAEMSARRSPVILFDPSNRVYDNGRAQVLHRAPQTPFQK